MSTTEPLDLEPIKAFRVPTMVVTSSPVPPVAAINLVFEQRRALIAEVERLRNTEAWDEVERLRGVVDAAKKRVAELEGARDHLLGVIDRLHTEKHDLAERLIQTRSKPT